MSSSDGYFDGGGANRPIQVCEWSLSVNVFHISLIPRRFTSSANCFLFEHLLEQNEKKHKTTTVVYNATTFSTTPSHRRTPALDPRRGALSVGTTLGALLGSIKAKVG